MASSEPAAVDDLGRQSPFNELSGIGGFAGFYKLSGPNVREGAYLGVSVRYTYTDKTSPPTRIVNISWSFDGKTLAKQTADNWFGTDGTDKWDETTHTLTIEDTLIPYGAILHFYHFPGGRYSAWTSFFEGHFGLLGPVIGANPIAPMSKDKFEGVYKSAPGKIPQCNLVIDKAGFPQLKIGDNEPDMMPLIVILNMTYMAKDYVFMFGSGLKTGKMMTMIHDKKSQNLQVLVEENEMSYEQEAIVANDGGAVSEIESKEEDTNPVMMIDERVKRMSEFAGFYVLDGQENDAIQKDAFVCVFSMIVTVMDQSALYVQISIFLQGTTSSDVKVFDFEPEWLQDSTLMIPVEDCPELGGMVLTFVHLDTGNLDGNINRVDGTIGSLAVSGASGIKSVPMSVFIGEYYGKESPKIALKIEKNPNEMDDDALPLVCFDFEDGHGLQPVEDFVYVPDMWFLRFVKDGITYKCALGVLPLATPEYGAGLVCQLAKGDSASTLTTIPSISLE